MRWAVLADQPSCESRSQAVPPLRAMPLQRTYRTR